MDNNFLQIADWLVAVWQDWQVLIRIILILLIGVIVWWILRVSVQRLVRGVVSGVKGRAGATDTKALESSPMAEARLIQRTRTIGSVLTNLITWGTSVVILMMVLSELGVAISALIAGAGFAGAALGFGAQSLVKDVISGIFIVFEDQYGVGDSVDLGQATGMIEAVGLRVTQVRDLEGTLWYVRNGEILRVGNKSEGWSLVVLDLGLPYQTNLTKAREVISKAAESVAASDLYRKVVIGKPEVWGLQAISGDQVIIRVVQQVRPSSTDALARELREKIKIALDAAKLPMSNPAAPIHIEVDGKTVKN